LKKWSVRKFNQAFIFEGIRQRALENYLALLARAFNYRNTKNKLMDLMTFSDDDCRPITAQNARFGSTIYGGGVVDYTFAEFTI
jgi:hypothetical protein